MITINKNTIAMWHLAKPGDFAFLSCLYRNEQDRLMFVYSFRHDDDPNNPHWWVVGPVSAEDEPKIEQTILGMIRMLEEATKRKADIIRMKNGDVKAFCAELAAKTYTQVSSVAPATRVN